MSGVAFGVYRAVGKRDTMAFVICWFGGVRFLFFSFLLYFRGGNVELPLRFLLDDVG